MSVIRECAQGHRFERLSPGPCPYCLGQLWRVDKSEKWDGGAPSATLTEKDLRDCFERENGHGAGESMEP